MASEERVAENLRKKLAAAVRNIQWSYAIFWSISTTQTGVLEWGDGHYNGDIKTRKTVQSVELDADQMGLQRSEQLRELYESLAAGEANPQARRPSAALSPEDLTDTEWYYLVCMSFVFNIDQGLPGRTLATGKPIWLSNAQYADSKIFSRSLLAKVSKFFMDKFGYTFADPYFLNVDYIQLLELLRPWPAECIYSDRCGTILILSFCNPTSAKLSEDPHIIQQIETFFLDTPYSIGPQRSNSRTGNADPDREFFASNLNPILECLEVKTGSSDSDSEEFRPSQHVEESYMVEGINGGASQIQSWQNMDDEFSVCVHSSLNSSDCISQTFANPRRRIPSPRGEKVNELLEPPEWNRLKLTSLDLGGDDLHYQRVLSLLLKGSNQLILCPRHRAGTQDSSFVRWKKGGLICPQKPIHATSQFVLKKILFQVAQMHGDCLVNTCREDIQKDGPWKPEADDIGRDHIMAERKREKLNERFLELKSLVPSMGKVDKVSILDDTIKYLKELERRVEELESCRESIDIYASAKRKPQDTVERTSDNYGNVTTRPRKPLTNKRKASDIGETEGGINKVLLRDYSNEDIRVTMIEEELFIGIRHPWRESLLLEIMDSISNLHLESHSVQSSILDGILSVTIKVPFSFLIIGAN
ncbi:Myc-type, basic helix-loop-helix (bHLH) domain [Dillenia turbinata]|uniref:Myc-type, basic helix-loop-helix (BHLH) domain n=1 Tax=Dillenia turbinata TaxID=194707 RepID=A0AAN8W9V9_9MAGN